MSLVIKTANIPCGRTPESVARDAIVRTLRGADIVLWQELEEQVPWLEKRRSKFKTLAFDEEYRQLERPITWNDETMELVRYGAIQLDNSRDGWELWAEFRERKTDKDLMVLNMHPPFRSSLRYPRMRATYKRIVAGLVDFVDLEPNARILAGGDWNNPPEKPILRPARRALPVLLAPPVPTHGTLERGKTIDFFLGRNIQPGIVFTKPRLGSDHNPVVVKLPDVWWV